jgi:hypothetical protein
MRLGVGIHTTFFSRTNQRDYRRTKEEEILDVPNCGFKKGRIGDINGRDEKKETVS